MSLTVLITGFGPFPGAPFNPTAPLAQELARRPHPGVAHVRRLAHVFHVSYEAVDRDLPTLLASERPDALIMFGLATRTRHVRIETRARNALTCALPDAAGRLPLSGTIVADGPAALPLPGPVQRLLLAARASGLPAALSRDAGHYLCNYLCWRAAEAARAGAPRLTCFIHVPPVRRTLVHWPRRTRLSLDELAEAGEAMVCAVAAAARCPSFSAR